MGYEAPGMRRTWFIVATALVVLLFPPHLHAVSPSPQISVTPYTVYTYESENFFVSVKDTAQIPIYSISISMPLGLQLVGTDRNPDWSHVLARNQTYYTASWYGLARISGGILVQPGNSSTFAFSANVPGPGTFSLAVTAQYFNGSSASLGTLAVVAYDPSVLGLTDVRSFVYVLGAIVILLPVVQSVALVKVRQLRRGGEG